MVRFVPVLTHFILRRSTHTQMNWSDSDAGKGVLCHNTHSSHKDRTDGEEKGEWGDVGLAPRRSWFCFHIGSFDKRLLQVLKSGSLWFEQRSGYEFYSQLCYQFTLCCWARANLCVPQLLQNVHLQSCVGAQLNLSICKEL